MKYFIVEYVTWDGEHEYSEFAVTAARTYSNAEKRAAKGRKLFIRYGWEEFCKVCDVHEIPGADYKVLKKYFQNLR